MEGTALVVDWPGARVVSSSIRVHEGARAAALHVSGMFRIDVTPRDDTMLIQVRSLAPVPLRTLPPEPPGRVASEGGAWERMVGAPHGHHDVRFDLGEDVEVRAVLTRVKDETHGTTLISGQALITPRRPSDAPRGA